MLWLYAEEDRYYSAPSIRRYHEAFARAGGIATFQLFPAFGSDGHRLVDRVELWQPAAADFPAAIELASIASRVSSSSAHGAGRGGRRRGAGLPLWDRIFWGQSKPQRTPISWLHRVRTAPATQRVPEGQPRPPPAPAPPGALPAHP